jgi:hypothetical protein
MWETIATLAIVPMLLVLFASVLRGSCSRSKENVVRWAKESGLQLNRCEWRCRGGELVLRIRVLDRDGRTRDGWVPCGSSLLGVVSHRTDVRFPHNVPGRSGSYCREGCPSLQYGASDGREISGPHRRTLS